MREEAKKWWQQAQSDLKAAKTSLSTRTTIGPVFKRSKQQKKL